MITLLWVLGVAAGWLLVGGLVGYVVGGAIRNRDRQVGEEG